jgi:hypothetical protein
MLITPGVYEALAAPCAAPAIVPPVARIVILGFWRALPAVEKAVKRIAVMSRIRVFITLNYKNYPNGKLKRPSTLLQVTGLLLCTKT